MPEYEDEGVNLLWSGQQEADERGFTFVGRDTHGQDLVPGNYLVADDRLMLVIGATEQHGYLSLLTDIKIPWTSSFPV